MISIRSIVHEYAATLERVWKHDRSRTVGASEIGACIRKTWFSKHNSPRDSDYQDSWGARERGNLIENYFWLPAMRAWAEREGVQLLFAGKDQKSLTSGHLSATTDGLLTGVSRDALAWAGIEDIGPGRSLIVECKSTDPRATITQVTARSEHKFQVHVQLGLMREFAPETAPEYAIISYIDASFLDNVTEYPVRFDPRIYAAAHARAEKIMTTRDALMLEPEGRISGGGECRWCPWQSHCAEVTIAGVPKAISILNDSDLVALREMRDDLIRYRARQEEVETQVAKKQEEIKRFMKERNTRRYQGQDWSVNYSTSSGKKSLDWEAVEEAGIDLSPFQKEGRGFERLVVK